MQGETPLAAIAGTDTSAAEGGWAAFFSQLKVNGCPLAAIILDEEVMFPGLNIWDQIGNLDHCRTLMKSIEFKRSAPMTIQVRRPEDFAGINPNDRTPVDLANYRLWQNWTYNLLNKVYRRVIVDTYHRYFTEPCVIGHYGQCLRTTPDGNGWPMPESTVNGWAMLDCYPWSGIMVNACPGGAEWGSMLYGVNHVRSSQSYPCMPYICYAGWDQDQDEHTSRRKLALWKNVQLWRHVFRMYDRAIYWEGPTVDPESDAIIADEIARANTDITKRDYTLPILQQTAESIVTLDHATARTGMFGAG